MVARTDAIANLHRIWDLETGACSAFVTRVRRFDCRVCRSSFDGASDSIGGQCFADDRAAGVKLNRGDGSAEQRTSWCYELSHE